MKGTMKKIIMSILMLAVFGTASAQMTPEEKAALKAAEKEAKSQVSDGIKLRDEINLLYKANQDEREKGEKKNQAVIDKNAADIKQKAEVANGLLMKALASGHVAPKQRFDACKALDDVSTHLLNPELERAAAKQTFDTLLFAKSVEGVCEGCYGQLEYGSPKDYEQKPLLAQAELKMPKLQIYYAYLCLFYTETKNLDGAMAAFDKYAGFAKKYPKVADEESVKNPQYPLSQFAFNLYLTAFNMKRYDICEKYYDLALQYPDEQSHNYLLSSRPQIYLQQGDTAQWVKSLENIIYDAPQSLNAEVATQNLMAYYSKKGPKAMNEFADNILAKDPESKMANYGKGYSLFAEEKYEEALPFFQKTVEIDPEYVDGYNMCGTSLYRKALDNNYKYVDGKVFKSKAAENEAKEKYLFVLLRQAVTYFETCREKAPEKPELWASALQNIYKNLGENAKAAELEPYMK